MDRFSAFYPAATALYESGDVPFARCVDCINYPVISKVQDEEFERIPRWFVEKSGQIHCVDKGDIILTKVGTPCFASIVDDYEEIALSRTVLGLTNIQGVNPYYLTAFLRSRFGFSQLMRERELTIQYQLTLDRVRKVLIYRASPTLQQAIEAMMRHHIAGLQVAKNQAEQAEATLLQALSLERWHPPEPLAYVRRASETVTAGRLDAAYFSPRVAGLLKSLGVDGLTIGDVAPPRHDQFTPIGSGTFDYIEISDVCSDGTATSQRLPYKEAPSRASWYVHRGDVITSTVRPSRRLSALILPDQGGFVCSSGFVVLQPCTVAPELLLTYLRLPLICELMDLHTSASMYPAISERNLLAIPFRRISQTKEADIVYLVRRAKDARRDAGIFLERGKRAVEIAIEESEEI